MLYLTRHGETDWNTKKILQGKKDSPLTEKGIADLLVLRDEIRNIDFLEIYSSPLGRAKETARILNLHNKEIILDPDLEEMGYGPWEGVPRDFLRERYGENFDNYFYRPELYVPVGGGEPFEKLFIRVDRALGRLRERSREGDILVVSHGVVIRMIYLILDGCGIEDLWNMPAVPNGKLIEMSF
ncbi:MAG: histidine phosphatase family protein [Tissierellia bacterium]|nr:histidine phosphatase family protein [Tissierellia bacterium]